MKVFIKKYGSLVGLCLLFLLIAWIGYQSFHAYLSGHEYYSTINSTSQNRRIFVVALLCVAFPMIYVFASSKINTKKMILRTGVGVAIFGLIHSNIKGDVLGIGNLITLFNTLLLFSLGVYLICGFSAIGSWIQKKIIKFKQIRRQEMVLSFGMGLIGFIVVVQILLGMGVLYGIVSRLLFISLGFMIRYERNQLSQRGDLISGIIENFKLKITSSKTGISGNIGHISLMVLLILSVAYIYIGIQNAFTPYSTAWDANHEYMYIPKILAENAGIYRGNTVANGMPGFWHQFLTFIFSLTGCTNGRFGLSSDNIAISMNNISAILVLIFGIAIIFQVFTLVNNKKEKIEEEKSDLKKGKNEISQPEISNSGGITTGRITLLLWLTSGMGAFLVIVDNKTDLGVMALSLLALLAGLIFLQNREATDDKKELLKYIIIAGMMFGFAALAKITAFVDFALFGLLLVGLRFSPITSLGLGIMVMGLARKLNILTSSVMLTSVESMWFIIIGGIIAIVGLIIHLLKHSNRKEFGRKFIDLVILGICFLIPVIVLKLPWATISQIKNNNYSFGNSLKTVFLSMEVGDNNDNQNKLLAQNIDDENMIDLEMQDEIDADWLILNNDKDEDTFDQCVSIGNIYSDDELNYDLQEMIGDGGSEDFGRYIGYGWKEFTKETIKYVDNEEKFEKNGVYWLLKLLWPTSETCYGLNHDAKVLCNNASVIDNFKIDDLRAIYENGIKDKEGEVGLLLKESIDAYNQAKFQGKITFGVSNTDLFRDEIVNLRQYYQSHSILSHSQGVNIPYRDLVPLNISFNWSLQNLSSYYTDIGFVWVIIYILLLVSLPYAIIKKDKILTAIALTTLIGRGIWWIIGSAILRYGTVLVSWTMITLALFIDKLFHKDKSEHPKILLGLFALLLVFIFSVQILFNFLRIISQGANSVFVRYKGNVGREQIIGKDLQVSSKVKYGYGWKNIFDLQFPQYNPIIHALAERDDKDGVIVAGTYIQYFLGNQWNIKSDGMLSDFWIKTSDGNLCKTYRRLKNDNTRYLIIDPNIGTVAMGEGNETLFYRFFGKLSRDESKIEQDGTIIMLIRLAKAGYMNLVSTNNIGSKYAFIIDDDTIREYFGHNLTDEEIILTRAKMAVLQYFGDANEIFGNIVNIFMSRIVYNTQGGIEDIANIYGLEVDSNKVAKVAQSYIRGQLDESLIEELSQNERVVLINYVNVYGSYSQGNTNETLSIVQNLLSSSVSGGSQIIALELN